MLVKELWRGNERVFACKISKQMFGEKNTAAAKPPTAALQCACEIIRDQTRNGVPAGTSIRQRRKLYRTRRQTASTAPQVLRQHRRSKKCRSVFNVRDE